MCCALAASSQFSVLLPLKWGSSQGLAESLESAAGIGVSNKLISLFPCFRNLENCNSKLVERDVSLLEMILFCSP